MKTKAAILVEQKKDLVVDEIEIPKLEHGKVLVEIKSTRICGSQLGEIDGVKGPDHYLPHLLGHEAGGIVREVGPLVTRVKEGDHVVCHWRPAPGLSGPCPTYKWQTKEVNAGHITTFNEHSILSESRLTPVGKNVDFDLCSLMADTLTTGFGVVTNDARLKIAESIVIIGVGGIGSGVVIGARLAGAHPIIAVDIHDHKLEIARKLGATHCINSSKEDLESSIRNLLGSGGADVVVEGTGNEKVIETAYQLTHSQGRCILFGVLPFDKKVSINTLPLHLGKRLIGSEGGQSKPASDIPRLVAMHQAGRYSIDGLITNRIGLEEVNQGIEKMRAGESIHTLIKF